MSDDTNTEDEAEETPQVVVPHEPVTIPLVYPIQFGERRIGSLTLRPLTAKEMRRTQGKNTMSIMLDYAGYLSGEPPQVIDLLQAVDAVEVTNAVTDFFGVSHRTGPEQ